MKANPDRGAARRDASVDRASVGLPSEKADAVLPVLDQWVTVMRAVNG